MDKCKGIIFDEQKGDTTIMLFDLDSDVQERHDVAAEHSDIVAKGESI